MPITDLATNVMLDNIGKVYFLKTGVYRDPVGLDNNHPLSSVSALLIHIEDGVPQNVMVANYAPSKMATWASHDFPLWYRGQVEYTIAGESAPRTFAQYFTYVPSILVAMNKNGTAIMNVDVTITQNTGANLLGGFADLSTLNSEFPPTELLSDDLATAYVYDSGTKGFYRVAWDGVSAWVWQLVDQALVTYGVQTKQYNVLPIKVQRGYAPSQTPLSVSDEVIRLIYQEIAYVNAVIANHTELIDDLELEVINNFQALKSLLGIATENDWNFEGEFPVNVMPEGEQAEGVNIPNSRYGWCQVGSDIYVFGGVTWQPGDVFDSTYSNRAYKYNVLTRTWTRLEDLPIKVNELRCAHKDGVIYMFGMGVTSPNDLDKMYKYTISTDTYTQIANPPIRIRMTSGAILIDDDVYVFVDRYWASGATPASITINTTPYKYNISLNEWTFIGTPANTSFDRGYAVLYNGKIYVQRSLKFQSYDPVANTWDTTLTPPTYGLVHTGLMHITHGRMFIGSGWESALAKNTGYIQYYNFERDTWQIATRLERDNEAIGYGTLVLYNSKLFYIGGYSDESAPVLNNYVRSFNLEKLQLDRVDALYQQVYALESRVDTAESDIEAVELRATNLEGRATNLENGKEDKSNKATNFSVKNDTLYPTTKAVDDDYIAKTANPLVNWVVNESTFVITITRYDGTTYQYDLPLETMAVDAYYDAENQDLVIVLQNGHEVTVPVDDIFIGLATQAWVTQQLTNYYTKSAADTLLGNKVDKVTGSSLIEDTKIAKLEDLYTQAEADAKLDLKLDKDISTLELYNIVDTDLFFKRSASGVLQRVTAQQAKDYFVSAGLTFDATVNYMTNGLGAFKSAVTMIHPVTLQTNGDFRCSIRAIETNTFIYVLFPTITATNTLRVSTNNGTNYYTVLKNGSSLRASIVSGQLVRLQFNGTNFIADIQSDIEVSETYTTKLNSTFGHFAPLDRGLPIVKEILGRTIPSLSNLVTAGGDFASGWTLTTATGSVSGGIYSFTATAQFGKLAQSPNMLLDNIYYTLARVKSNSNLVGLSAVSIGIFTTYHSGSNTYEILKGGYKNTLANGVREIRVIDTRTADWTQTDVDYIMLFNLTSSHGVTATSGTAYDNAVADIEAMLALNSGYISSTSTTHVEDSEFKATGKNLFDKNSSFVANNFYSSTTGNLSSSVGVDAYKSRVMPNTTYIKVNFGTSQLAFYDIDNQFISGTTSLSFTTPANCAYVGYGILVANKDTAQLEQGTVVTTYAPYNTETQLFNHARLSKLPNLVADKIRYLNGAYVLDKYVEEYALVSGDISAIGNFTNAQQVTVTNALANMLVASLTSNKDDKTLLSGFTEIGATTTGNSALPYQYYIRKDGVATLFWIYVPLGTYANLSAAQTALAGTKIWYQLATPLLANSVIDVDGVLMQEATTTVEQLQNIPTSVTIEYSMDIEQTTKTLVERDKLQQLEIDSLEARATDLEARKVTSNDIVVMSATAWSTYTRVDGKAYGVYNESTGVITWYYGVVGV